MADETLTTAPEIEQRVVPRRKSFIGAKIIVDNNSTFNCLIKTRSEKGFGLKLGSTAGVPDQFTLLDETSGLRHLCQVIWRKKGGLGVQVIDGSL